MGVSELGEKPAGGVLEREGLEIGEGGFHEGYFRRFTLLAASRVRIWVMAMPLSMARRSGCGRP